MSGVAFEIRLSGTAPDSVRTLLDGLSPAQINPIIGREARNVYREHLFGLNATRPNALGGARTNFYAGAARATQFRVQGDTVIVSINQVGIRQRYFGGTIKPSKKFLTIPAIPEAHGKRASEFSDLHFAYEYNPAIDHYQAALVQGARSLLGRKRVKGQIKTYFAGVQNRRVVFWLAKQVTQQPDETVLPYPQLVESRAVKAASDYALLLWQRRQPSTGANN